MSYLRHVPRATLVGAICLAGVVGAAIVRPAETSETSHEVIVEAPVQEESASPTELTSTTERERSLDDVRDVDQQFFEQFLMMPQTAVGDDATAGASTTDAVSTTTTQMEEIHSDATSAAPVVSAAPATTVAPAAPVVPTAPSTTVAPSTTAAPVVPTAPSTTAAPVVPTAPSTTAAPVVPTAPSTTAAPVVPTAPSTTAAPTTTVAPVQQGQVLISMDFNDPSLSGQTLDRSTIEHLLGYDVRYAAGVSALQVRDGYMRQSYVPSPRGTPVVEFPTTGLASHDELWLSYDVYFEPGFEWVLGGKLPGLAGGDVPSGGSGGNGADGFSARMGWSADGQINVYSYHPDRPGQYGEVIPLSGRVYAGTWYRIVERVVMNTGNEANGSVEVWVNGENRLTRTGMRWRTTGSFGVDSFIYASFYGGNSSEWSPSTTTAARFDSFLVATSAPASFTRP